MSLDIHDAAMSIEKEQRRRERLELAGRAMQAYLESFANATELDLRWVPMAFRIADALLAELDKEQT